MVLLIDNYDSFVHNLARYLRRLGQETRVVRNDAITPAEVVALGPAAIMLSPGPCTPSEAGCSLELVKRVAGKIPLLGVCLGHQTIGMALGGQVIRAPSPMHGRASRIQHDNRGLFAGLPNPLVVGRYHSLIVDETTLPCELEVTARTDDGIIMALTHREWAVFGVQFHPESILTDGGFQILANFLRTAGLEPRGMAPNMRERREAMLPAPKLPTQAVTF